MEVLKLPFSPALYHGQGLHLVWFGAYIFLTSLQLPCSPQEEKKKYLYNCHKAWNFLLPSPLGLNIFSVKGAFWPSAYSCKTFITSKPSYNLFPVPETFSSSLFSPHPLTHLLPSLPDSYAAFRSKLQCQFVHDSFHNPSRTHPVTLCNFPALSNFFKKSISPSVL